MSGNGEEQDRHEKRDYCQHLESCLSSKKNGAKECVIKLGKTHANLHGLSRVLIIGK